MGKPVYAVRILARGLVMAGTVLGPACGAQDRLQSLPTVPAAATAYQTQYEGCALKPVFRAARSQGEWRTVLAEMGHRCDSAFADSVDFGRVMLLTAASGSRAHGSRGVTIERAGMLGDTLHVLVQVREPGRCTATMAPSSPMHVVRLPRSDAPVRFHVRTEKRCD